MRRPSDPLPAMTRPHQRLALGGLAAACLAAAGAFALALVPAGGLAAAVLLAFATALLMAALVGLGGGGDGGAGALTLAVFTLVVVVGGGVAGAFLLGAPEGPGARLWGGLPRGAALLVYGAGLVPAVVVPLIYAWTFDRTTLRPDVLDEVRRRGREFERRHPDDGGAP